MKTIKKYLVLAVLAIMVCFSAGCSAGSTINTDLFLNPDLSGQRVFSLVINQSVFNENFHGEAGDVYSFISGNCPEQLQWTYSEDNGDWTYTFTLAFDSLDDYKQKVTALIGEERTISIDLANTVWSKGVYVSEDFNSKDLLGWLKDGLVQAGFIDEGNAGKVFSDGTTNFIYQDEVNNTSANIYYDHIRYIDIASIRFLTEVVDLGNYNRTVKFSVYTSNLGDGDSGEIEEFFNSCMQSGMSLDVATEGDYTVYTVSQNGMDSTGVCNFDKALFGEENVEAAQENKDYALAALQLGECITENITLNNYLASDRYTTITYSVKLPEDFYLDTDRYLSWVRGADSFYEDSAYPEYVVLFNYYDRSFNSNFSILKPIEVSGMYISVKHSEFGDKFTVTNDVTLSGTPKEEEVAKVVEHLQSLVAPEEPETIEGETEGETDVAEESVEETEEETDEETDEETEEPEEVDEDTFVPSEIDCTTEIVSAVNEEGKTVITITQKGDANSIISGQETIYGDSANSIDYSRTGSFLSPVKQEAYIYSIDFSRFVYKQAPKGYAIETSLDLGTFAKPNEYLFSDMLGTVEDGCYTESTDENYVDIKYAGTMVDIFGILFWVFIVVALVCIVLAILKSGIIDMEANKQKKAAKKAAKMQAEALKQQQAAYQQAAAQQAAVQQGAYQQPIAQQPIAQQVTAQPVTQPTGAFAFCPNCGAKIAEGSAFCEKCGTKLQ